MQKEDGSNKKVLLYYIGSSSFVQYKERMIAKMKETFQIFEENRKDIVILWKVQSKIKERLKEISDELYQEYGKLEKEFFDRKLGIMNEDMEEKTIVAICDAYYGEPSHMVQLCRNAKLPVMLQSVEL